MRHEGLACMGSQQNKVTVTSGGLELPNRRRAQRGRGYEGHALWEVSPFV